MGTLKRTVAAHTHNADRNTTLTARRALMHFLCSEHIGATATTHQPVTKGDHCTLVLQTDTTLERNNRAVQHTWKRVHEDI